ncbi:serine/threonine protein kinase [Microbacterium sp. HD4P20]|uniref:serine/threonine-protein kinase n=1 Tax=Microbacterium sp. HD4P20 TaxID=2864874 RepID=UPI001C6414A0|nr:serine/threonine-protein kinase [Microbacterium sp. HD4P20]MCP2637555.1 serine/threonine protein kinase [Microbacterium sp. HD4P20]
MTDLREAGELSTGELLNGRYRLEQRIGQGGMAMVYRAEDTHLNRTVAIKVVRGPVDAPDVTERARAETRILASLNHHSLVTVFDARISDTDASYIVMEYVEGNTLGDRIRLGPIDDSDVASTALDVAEALHVAHSAGIVHRDIKPSNVLLGPSPLPGPSWHAKLADFGIAFLLDTTRVTTPGLVVGTPAYIAPEQAQGAAPAPASDIYAFGIMLIEALTGTRPYADAEGIGAVVARLISPPAVPDSLRPEWQGLLRGMTATRPEDRPTALEVATVAGRLIPAAGTAAVDQPTAAMKMETRPTMVLPAAGAAAASIGAGLVAANSPDETAAADESPAGSAAGAASSAGSGVPLMAVSTVPASATAGSAIEVEERAARAATDVPVRGAEEEAPRRRRALAFLTGASVIALALAGMIWGINVAGTAPDPAPTTPLVEDTPVPSGTPTPLPPAPVVDQGDDGGGGNGGEGGGNGGEGGGNGNPGNGNGNQGNGNQGNGNQGNGNQGNGNQGNGNGNQNQDTETGDTVTDTETETDPGTGETPPPQSTPNPSDTTIPDDGDTQGAGSGGQGSGRG